MANHKITIYHDGTILTMDADFPQVEALAVMDGRIVATGSLKDVKQAVGDGADLVSLEGGTLLPGFIDGHSHFCSGGMNRGRLCCGEHGSPQGEPAPQAA